MVDIKSRTISSRIYGSAENSLGTTNLDIQQIVEQQRTLSHNTMFPATRRALAGNTFRGTGAEWVFTHRDFGAAFITERNTVESSLDGLWLSNIRKGKTLPYYNVGHYGPCFLANHNLTSNYTDAQRGNAEQEIFMLGARAINRARPNKPSVDLPVLLGELRKDGIPTIVGSLAIRSRNVRDVFRRGGNEYLNIQFGWAPLLKDLSALLALIPESRRILEQYERDIDRLVRRRYHFPDQVDVSAQQLSGAASNWGRQSGTPWGSVPEDHMSFKPTGQVMDRVTKTTVETWFSGGFRFYHRSVPKALEELSLFEEKANALLGTRLDPEVLWNLVPWTWLSDWFINFGDVVANASAIIADNLVMQYGYIMRTTRIVVEDTWSQGLWIRKPVGNLTSVWGQATPAYTQTTSRVIKQRGRASPFGFGLNPSDFSFDQLAILAALGLSKS